jgi:putative Ca2+/H+ antiporter (TMEM165/GDT1 family)
VPFDVIGIHFIRAGKKQGKSHGMETLFHRVRGTFIAEMADKTQLVTLLFAADKEVSKLTVFLGSALALVLASAIRWRPAHCCHN